MSHFGGSNALGADIEDNATEKMDRLFLCAV